MHDDIETIGIANDVTFQNDIKGPALFVLWRNVPVGIIRPLTANQVSSWARKLPKNERLPFRNRYRELMGKWCDSLAGDVYFDTKEDAAHDLVLRSLRNSSRAPLIQAGLLEDRVEVARLLQQSRRTCDVHVFICIDDKCDTLSSFVLSTPIFGHPPLPRGGQVSS